MRASFRSKSFDPRDCPIRTPFGFPGAHQPGFKIPLSAFYQLSPIFLAPASFGCTQSVVSAMLQSELVQRSATNTGDCAVRSPCAQAGTAFTSDSASFVFESSLLQLGLILWICATTRATAALCARACWTSVV